MKPITYPTDTSTKATDRYLTPRWLVYLVRLFWLRGIDCDPFHEPDSHVKARNVIDSRNGGNAYVDPWIGATALVNGPYSGRYPGSTAKRCAELHAMTGIEIFNVCPAAPGSDYWRAYVWPNASAIVWLGRLAFEAATDIVNDKGEVTCPKGHAAKGNRTEIAMPYLGDDPHRVRQIFAARAEITILTS